MAEVNGTLSRSLEEDATLKSNPGKSFENNESWSSKKTKSYTSKEHESSSFPTENGNSIRENDMVTEEKDISEDEIPRTISGSSFSQQRKSMVTQDRKESLLVKARADRLEWIQKVPLPYKQSFLTEDGKVDVWSTDERLGMIRSSRVAVEVPSITKVCSLLYGIDNHDNDATPHTEEIASRVGSLLEPLASTKKDRDFAMPSGKELLDIEMNKLDKADNTQKMALMSYQQFMINIQKPNNTMFVQRLRNFVRNLHQMDEDERKDTEKLATSMKTYISSTYESLKSHESWMNEAISQETTRRSLESFLYGHCQDLLWSTLLEEEENNFKTDQEWLEQIKSLQFVTPEHLEIECLIPAEKGSLETIQENVDWVLKDPVDILLSVDRYYSPYEKLQRILAVYHGVNKVLSEALNNNNDVTINKDSSSQNKKLPSADDVLPTLILTVLRAKPNKMISNLRFIEAFCSPDQLRGEAGYAYTNLYGAVQFLRDLDIDIHSDTSGTNSLSISAEEFKKGLIECQKTAESRLSHKTDSSLSQKDTNVAAFAPDLSPADIRCARLRGEDVNFDWAVQWQHDKQKAAELESISKDDTTSALDRTTADIDILPDSLPQGFTRSYSFLTTRPEDVRMSDLSQLLAEYKMMVHTTEILLAERNARIVSERKQQREEARKALEKSAAAVDLTLFRDKKGS